ncbi:hypothetical protein AMECASPLE_034026 [Ameca splendens]|uniref:Uncharacterized protein n=1 Tax=Ameca splendens TaxID=208324 RepID=A0ABV0Y6X3_9TELE
MMSIDRPTPSLNILSFAVGSSVSGVNDADDIDSARESLIRGLCIFLSEDPDDLVQEYMEVTEAATLQCHRNNTCWNLHISRNSQQ